MKKTGKKMKTAKKMKRTGKKSDKIRITIPKDNPWAIVSAILAVVLIISLAQILTTDGKTWSSVTPTSPTGSAVTAAASTQAQSSQSSGIGEKYQQIVDQLSGLEGKTEGCDPSIVNAVQSLSEEVHDLRVLNPYYRFQEIKNSALPSGIPAIYGQELEISFDKVQEAIDTVAPFGPTYGQEGKKIILAGADLQRYITIGSQTACKYCCGVKTLVSQDGTAACGCAHSQMMRGLAAYLIKNHPELSDEQILGELNRWRAVFFPKQAISKVIQEKIEAGEEGIEELLEEFPDFLPQMVGGC